MSVAPRTLKELKTASTTTPQNNAILRKQAQQKNAEIYSPQAAQMQMQQPAQPVHQEAKMQNEYGQKQPQDFQEPPFIQQSKSELQDLADRSMPQQAPVQQPPRGYQPAPQQRTYSSQKSAITVRMEQAENEIDGLVSNTKEFIEKTAQLKLDIIGARTAEQLETYREEAEQALSDIPEGFIDADTVRKIRICFGHIIRTKKDLLAQESGLAALAAIGDPAELDSAFVNVQASAAADALYEARTAELTLIGKLPEIKDAMIRDRMMEVCKN